MMQKKKSFMVDFGKMAVSVTIGIFLLVILIVMILENRMTSAVIFLIISIIFLRESMKNAPLVSFDEEGVSERLFGRYVRRMSWGEVAEVGVIGTKVFNRKKPEKTGRMYLYFSKEEISEDDHFALMLKWPPRKIIYTLYKNEQVESLRSVWCGKIETYNVGDLRL